LILNHQVKYRDDGSQRQACGRFEGETRKRGRIVDRRSWSSYGPAGLNGWPSAAQAIFISAKMDDLP
jgi:hypothetical protein